MRLVWADVRRGSRVSALLSAAEAFPVSTTTRSFVFEARKLSCRPSLPGSGAKVSQVTFNCLAARTASHSRSAATATKFPLRTIAAGNLLDRLFVDTDQFRTIGAVCTLSSGPHHSAVQHPGYTDVLDIYVFAADFLWYVESRNSGPTTLYSARGFWGSIVGIGPRELNTDSPVRDGLIPSIESLVTQ